jgi:hypothetical protein
VCGSHNHPIPSSDYLASEKPFHVRFRYAAPALPVSSGAIALVKSWRVLKLVRLPECRETDTRPETRVAELFFNAHLDRAHRIIEERARVFSSWSKRIASSRLIFSVR